MLEVLEEAQTLLAVCCTGWRCLQQLCQAQERLPAKIGRCWQAVTACAG